MDHERFRRFVPMSLYFALRSSHDVQGSERSVRAA
jgi:hypothetical protein